MAVIPLLRPSFSVVWQVEKPSAFAPFGRNNINHLTQVLLEFFCVD